MTMTLKQYDIAGTILRNTDKCTLEEAVELISLIFGKTAEEKDIVISYKSLGW